MSPIPTGPGQGRFIIRSRNENQPLTELLGAIRNDPGISIVDAIGPAGTPHTVVAEMSNDAARSLEQRFQSSNQLIIEPDRPLSMFQ